MAKVIVYYAHPGQRYSHVNKHMFRVAQEVDGITAVELYREYPRFNIDIEKEQQRLLDHDVVVLQYPVFWYSSPALIKEWLDLVLEHGFAYGHGGTQLAGKTLMLAVTAAGPEDAYTAEGYQGHSLRTFLTPMQQTANLCKMRFLPPYVLYGSLKAPKEGKVHPHVEGYRHLLEALRDDRYDAEGAVARDYITFTNLPIHQDA